MALSDMRRPRWLFAPPPPSSARRLQLQPARFYHVLRAFGITIVQGTPSLLLPYVIPGPSMAC
jgi:hypothetical protein